MHPAQVRPVFNNQVVIPGVEQQTKRPRITKSIGRGQVCAPQGNIVSTVRFVRPEIVYASRKPVADDAVRSGRADTLLAPLGSERAFHVYKGDLVYSLVTPSAELNARKYVDRDAEEEVFSHVGGLTINQELRFAGHCDFSPHEPGNDDVGTIARAGTRTVINTGPNVISVNEHVYFANKPHVARDEANTGAELPIIDEVGQPKDKFRPPLYGLKGHQVYATLVNLERKVDRQILDAVVRGLDFSNTLITLYQKIDNDWVVDLPKEHPSIAYAKLYTLFRAYKSDVMQNPADDNKRWLKELKDLWYGPLVQEQEQYLKAIGQGVSNNNHPVYTKITQDNPEGGLLEEYTRQALMQANSKMHEYLRSHLIGRCTRGAGPGQALDIDIGYAFI
jgi:hypothetical protein